MITHGKMLKFLKDSVKNNNFENFPVIFFNENTGDIYPYERIKDFCLYWLQKDIELYREFRNEFALYRNDKLKLLEAVSVLFKDDVRKKINSVTMLKFRIMVLNYTDSISVILNLAEMLVACCSSIIEELSEKQTKEICDKISDDKK